MLVCTQTNAYLELPTAIWGYLKLSRAIWSYLGLSRAIWSDLELSGAIWSYLEQPGATWSYLELSELSPDSFKLQIRICVSKQAYSMNPINNYSIVKCNIALHKELNAQFNSR